MLIGSCFSVLLTVSLIPDWSTCGFFIAAFFSLCPSQSELQSTHTCTVEIESYWATQQAIRHLVSRQSREPAAVLIFPEKYSWPARDQSRQQPDSPQNLKTQPERCFMSLPSCLSSPTKLASQKNSIMFPDQHIETIYRKLKPLTSRLYVHV